MSVINSLRVDSSQEPVTYIGVDCLRLLHYHPLSHIALYYLAYIDGERTADFAHSASVAQNIIIQKIFKCC